MCQLAPDQADGRTAMSQDQASRAMYTVNNAQSPPRSHSARLDRLPAASTSLRHHVP
jgi:hypothetical protein